MPSPQSPRRLRRAARNLAVLPAPCLPCCAASSLTITEPSLAVPSPKLLLQLPCLPAPHGLTKKPSPQPPHKTATVPLASLAVAAKRR
ncbi:hypothetical protein M0R45_019121 [Rubus argutus]|uniref:Secreted protein n=1 Tax=Rubus argutus TaxID=59490 RepID=A0AAW1X4Z8_RUBAR